ncbi:MAG TPA: hypothetical protein VFG69_17925 [Nannocystaceae bacterium]|nr:hypothetical protein [Nannocystaceae bacterium]
MTHQFGRSIATHRGTFAAGGWLWYVGAILIASGVAPLVAGQLPLAQGLGTALAGVGIGALLVLGAAMRWRQTLVLHERGFELTRLLRRTVTVGATEVASVEHWTRRSAGGVEAAVLVHLRSGRTIEMSRLERSDQIVAVVRSWTTPAAPPVSWQPHDGGV